MTPVFSNSQARGSPFTRQAPRHTPCHRPGAPRPPAAAASWPPPLPPSPAAPRSQRPAARAAAAPPRPQQQTPARLPGAGHSRQLQGALKAPRNWQPLPALHHPLVTRYGALRPPEPPFPPAARGPPPARHVAPPLAPPAAAAGQPLRVAAAGAEAGSTRRGKGLKWQHKVQPYEDTKCKYGTW